MVEFLSKFRGRGIKITIVSSIRVAKTLIFSNIVHAIFFNIIRAGDVILSHRFLGSTCAYLTVNICWL